MAATRRPAARRSLISKGYQGSRFQAPGGRGRLNGGPREDLALGDHAGIAGEEPAPGFRVPVHREWKAPLRLHRQGQPGLAEVEADGGAGEAAGAARERLVLDSTLESADLHPVDGREADEVDVGPGSAEDRMAPEPRPKLADRGGLQPFRPEQHEVRNADDDAPARMAADIGAATNLYSQRLRRRGRSGKLQGGAAFVEPPGRDVAGAGAQPDRP